MAEIFNLAERIQRLPAELCKALVSYIPKEDATILAADKVRPISVLPLVLRLYVSSRAEFPTSVLNDKLLDQQWGGRPARGVTQPLLLTDILLDLARKDHRGVVYAAQLDVSKFFNNIDPLPLMPILVRAGVPQELVSVLQQLYASMVFINKYHAGLSGPSWRPVRGIPQGDACAVILANMYMRVVLNHAGTASIQDRGQMPAVFAGCHAFLDDVTLISVTKQDLQQKVARLVQEMQSVGLAVNVQNQLGLQLEKVLMKSHSMLMARSYLELILQHSWGLTLGSQLVISTLKAPRD